MVPRPTLRRRVFQVLEFHDPDHRPGQVFRFVLVTLIEVHGGGG